MTQHHTLAARYSAAAGKLEMILDGLTAVDRATAERCLAYCQARAAGGRENFVTEAAIDKFVEQHDLSLDWLFDPAKAA